MRGRKGKYYSQVDDEDQSFLEQEKRLREEDEEEDEDLHMIEEEDGQESLGDLENTQRKDNDEDMKLLNSGHMNDFMAKDKHDD